MARCVNCTIVFHRNEMHEYRVMDMCPEMISVLQEWTTREAADGDRLCQQCFYHIVEEFNNRLRGNVGERQLGHERVCVGCGLSLTRQTGRRSRLISTQSPEYAFVPHFPQFPGDVYACNSCWQSAHRQALQQEQQQREIQVEQPGGSSSTIDPLSQSSSDNPEAEPLADNQPGTFLLNGYSRTPNTTTHCLVPDCPNEDRRRMPKYLRKKILIESKIFVTAEARICREHLSQYDVDFLNEYEFTREFNSTQMVEMLDLLRDQKASGLINFEKIENENEQLCKYWTGLTILQFLMVFASLTQLVGLCRKPRTALGLFLVRLRTGEPLRRIASLFCISTSLLCSYIKKTRNCLLTQYVPIHLGLSHITREGISQRNLLIPNGLFGTASNNPIVLMDGTYVYLQKSSNYLFQKKSYSLHKFANVVKPFLMVASDGHIIDVFGPYAATTSDADIVKHLFQNQQSASRQFFRRDDVFLLDRGFRDAIPLLRSLGYNVHKPESLSVGENQLTTFKANKSRTVTMCRWVIEIVNGRFKRDFKLFRVKYFNLATTHLIEDFRIAAALINHFHPAVTDRPDAQAILNRALERINMPNYLADFVIQNNLNRHRVNFLFINARIPQLSMFPVMQMTDLVLFALGTYQIKQARSYYGEHIRARGSFFVEVSDEIDTIQIPGISSSHETQLVRGRIRSRHQSNKIYYSYILIKMITDGDWRDRICGYYCNCIVGKRTVGSCAHVMTIIWYLGWARHQGDNITPPAQFLDHILVRDDLENEEVDEEDE